MSTPARTIIGLIAALHLAVAAIEMFAWTTIGPRVFSTLPAELFEPTRAIAANQGIYNAFLATGLFWSLFVDDATWQRRIALCFLGFVAVAGVVGALTVSPRILLVQTVPAIVGIALALRGRGIASD